MNRTHNTSIPGKRRFILTAGAALVMAGLLLTGCSTMKAQNWGTFKASDDVRNIFESYTIDPAYNYYYSGSYAHPIAVMGVKRGLRFEPADLWKRVKNPEQLKDMITGMESYLRTLNHPAWGFAILDKNHQQIGIWYSIPKATTAVVEKNDGSVIIYTPDIETYMKLEREI
jgi:hypothetical protein